MFEPLTVLQFRVIGIIGAREVSGREIREALKAEGISRTRAATYDLLSRMGDNKLVKSKTVEDVEKGETYVRKLFRVSGHGVKAYNATRQFYLDRGDAFEGLAAR